MHFTIEQRRLLEGDEQRTARKEPALGFGDASTAPDRFKLRILEVRTAVIEKRAIPAPSAEYRSAAQLAYRVPTAAEQLRRNAVRKLNMPSVFGPDGKIHLSLEERLLASAYTIRKDREAFEAAEQKRILLTDFSAIGKDNFRHWAEDRLNKA